MARLSQELALFSQIQSLVDPLSSPASEAGSLEERIRVEQILKLAGERSFGLFLVVLSLPSALPLPAPGYSTPFGLLIVLLAAQLAMGRTTPWLPEWVLQKSIQLNQFQRLVQAGIPWLQRIEKISRPRWTYLCTSRLSRGVLGTLITLMGISMIIPIPGTNTLPAIGVFVTAFGLMEEDGILCSLGSLICVAGGFLTTSILVGLWLGGATLLDWLGW
ncbi:exopolysaccharide biosynthesis protein [Thermostichus vulcanus]|uniref:Exopolysaccharide biosynthesis protein n=1 Tax=Thermostichus vulcanus str. 'Rupite' TaxID=2813851 RepID=A0ABT0CCT2_THEVL|nr:exopolysaccharide biosynthesis protein [Thermostichus vulcanus]MCJ2543602.1 exopolysaccharide biosynthesis protein [Thermostichus vulcanus str. 'Rupite']